MANNLVPLFTGIGESSFENLSDYDNRFLMVAYSSGVIAVFLVFFLLYWNAYRQRAALALPPDVVFDTRTGMRAHALSVSLGMASVILALTMPIGWRFGLAGMVYALEGPFQGLNGYFSGRARARRFPSSTPAHR